MGLLAALGGDGLWLPGADAPLPVRWGTVRDVADLFIAMDRRGVELLYVHRSALEPLGLPAELEIPRPDERRPAHPFVEGVSWRGEGTSQRALSPSIECAGLEVMIGAYQDGSGDPFDEAADARELLAAAEAFRQAFVKPRRPEGWAFRHSAMLTGWQLMTSARRTKQERTLTLADRRHPDLEGLEPGQQVEQPYGSWCRAPVDSQTTEDLLAFVLAYDVNGQRLAACSRLPLGVTGLEQRERAPFDKKLPGYHLVRAVERPYVGLIPPIMEPGWHTTPRVAMAEHLGIAVEIERSWVWTEAVPYLDTFYNAMRDARERLMKGADPAVNADWRAWGLALGALKQCYLQPFGRLRSQRSRETNSIYYRPHWYDSIIGQEVAREYLRLHQLAEAGVPVLGVYFDTILIEADTDDLQAGAPGPLELSNQLGKYKPVGSCPSGPARACLYGVGDEPPGGVRVLVKAIKARAAVKPTPGGQENGRAGGGHPVSEQPARPAVLRRPLHGGYPTPERTHA